jgi:hypothetical protein
MPDKPTDVTPYAFAIRRQQTPDAKPTKWYEDTEYGLPSTLRTIAGLIGALADPSTVVTISITRVERS